MNTPNIISINPTSQPRGINVAKEIFEKSGVVVEKPISAMRQSLKLLLGVNCSAYDSRRLWTFRVILGSILMAFGLLLLHTEVYAVSERVMPGISVAMIVGGACIACGLFTRLVSLALGIILIVALSHIGFVYMTGFSLFVCIATCISGVVAGSGRYSLDTLIYNAIVGMSR